MKDFYFVTKSDIKTMMLGTGQTLVAETAYTLEYSQPNSDAMILFEFGQNGFLIRVTA